MLNEGNAIKKLRVAFELTPSELAERLGIDNALMARIEDKARPVTDEWANAVAAALGAPAECLFDPEADYPAIAAQCRAAGAHARRPASPALKDIRIGVRYGLQAIIGKLADAGAARELLHDEVESATQSVIDYAFGDADEAITAPLSATQINDLEQGLQLAAATALQSRTASSTLRSQAHLAHLAKGATALIEILLAPAPDDPDVAG